MFATFREQTLANLLSYLIKRQIPKLNQTALRKKVTIKIMKSNTEENSRKVQIQIKVL